MNMITPTKEDMMRMVRAFVSVHQDNVKDDIGPNKPDAPFFERVAEKDEMDEEDYMEMSERLYKYIRTQVPTIMAIAGYPPDTDWPTALESLYHIGEQAKAVREEREAKEKEYNALVSKGKNIVNKSIRKMIHGNGCNTTYTHLSDAELQSIHESLLRTGIEIGDVDDMVNGMNETGESSAESRRRMHIVTAEQYEETWYSKNDYRQRYPRTSKRVKVIWKGRNTQLYYELKNTVGFPAFKYDGSYMSCSLDKGVIDSVSKILREHNYDPTELEKIGNGLVTMDNTSSTSAYAVTLKNDALLIKLPYNDTTCRNAVKAINGRRWLSEPKMWSVPMSEATFLIKKLNEASEWGDEKPKMLLDALGKISALNDYLTVKAERIAISSAASLADDSHVSDMKERLSEYFPEGRELYPFQYAGVRYAELSPNNKVLIGDDMGLGKTVQAIAYAALHDEFWPVLVVCPANVKYNWYEEIRSWLPDVDVQVVKNGKDPIEGATFTVINYDLVSKREADLTALGADLLVFDESHYLKNNKAKRTQACMNIAGQTESVLCLSGTAITNRPIELFTTLNMIRPAEYNNYFAYAKRYCGAEHNGFGWNFSGSSNTEELHEKLRDCMIRRLKKEVLAELPDKVRSFVPVVPNAKEMAQYKRTHKWWMNRYAHYKNNGGMPAGFVLNMLTELRHEAGRLKVGATADWVSEYQHQNEGKPIIVFYHHKDVGQGLLDLMTDDKRFNHKRWRVIAGGTPAEKRTQYVNQFQAGALDGLLCSTVAAKEGLTLTAADTVVFIEREWVPGWEEQAEDRVNRIGQDSDTVFATYLSVLGTIDEKFDRVVEDKRRTVSAILDGGEIGEERAGIAKALLEAMVEAGDVPADMLKHVGVGKPKTHGEKKGDEKECLE